MSRAVLAFVAAVSVAACGERSHPATSEEAALAIVVQALESPPLATIVVEVTASDIPVPLVFNLTVTGGVATGTLRMPPGRARTIAVRAYEPGGAVSHEGSKTVDVQRGFNPPVSIPMVSRAAQVPITVEIGSVVVAVEPASATLVVGETLQLRATLLAPNGDVLPDEPQWATSNPSVVAVDADGLAVAVGEGEADVVATFAGVAGVAHLTTSAVGRWTGARQFGTANQDEARAVAVDRATGSVYVVGSLNVFGESPGGDGFVAKFGPAGDERYTLRVPGTGVDRGTGVAVDASGNVIVVGRTSSSYSFVVKLDPLGNVLYAVRISDLDVPRYWAAGVAVDASGNAFVVGRVDGPAWPQGAAFLAKVDPAGSVVSLNVFGSRASGSSVAVDAAGAAYVAGYDYAGDVQSAVVRKVGPAGDVVYTSTLATTPGSAFALGIAVNAAGEAWVVGAEGCSPAYTGGCDAFRAKLDASGNQVFIRAFGSPGEDVATAVALDASGRAHYVGWFKAIPGDPRPAAAFYSICDSSGEDVLGTGFDTPDADFPWGIALDAGGNAFVAGSTRGSLGAPSAGADDVFVVKFDAAGVMQ